MSSTPEPDPYLVLGVQKDATIAEIKTAYRKLALKYHPDKIKDDSLRDQAVDEFQKVLQAYEILSDDTKRARYDQKIRLAELRRQMERDATVNGSHSSPRASTSSTSREFRDGRVYEERVPADNVWFEDEMHFTEEPRSTSRKYEGHGRRQRSKGLDEKRRSKTDPLGSPRNLKEMVRESVRYAYVDRAKSRTKERRRESSAKYERVVPTADSYDEESSDNVEPVYVRQRHPCESRAFYKSSSRGTRLETSRKSEPRTYEDDDFSDSYETKHEYLHTNARDYILRSKGKPPVEIDSRNHSSRSPQRYRGYESTDPEQQQSSRRSRRSRSVRSMQETDQPPYSRRSPNAQLDPQAFNYSFEQKVPSMPTVATSPGIRGSSSRPSLQRSATAAYVKPKRESSSRADYLSNMVFDDIPCSRSSKVKNMEKHDSGYSSPGTPEMYQSSSPAKSSTRYRVTHDRDTIVVESDEPSPRHQRTYSPTHPEPSPNPARFAPRPVRSSTTYTYSPDTCAHYETTRPKAYSSKPLSGDSEVRFRPKTGSVKYAREIGPDDVIYSRHHLSDDHRQPTPRRQSAYA